MGEAKRRNAERRSAPVGKCIYCGATEALSDEHVIPYGLGGVLVLPKASCRACSDITSALELRLLRRAWWPYRRALRLTSRHPNKQPDDFPVTLHSSAGESARALLPANDHPMVTAFLFPSPAVLLGQQNSDPVVGKVVIRRVAPLPTAIIVDGTKRSLRLDERIEYPIEMDAADFARFLAKVGLGYAIFELGIEAFAELFLAKIVLGNGDGALTFLGNPAGSIQPAVIPDPPLQGLMLRREGPLCSVYVQLFKDGKSDPPPIYQVVVGKLTGPIPAYDRPTA